MRIAIPTVGGQLAAHFGRCEQFALFDVDSEAAKITSEEAVDAPPHEPGLLPRWLSERGVNIVIAGGMGGRAQGLFAGEGIEVALGVGVTEPQALVQDYLSGQLSTGRNVCDHGC